MVPQPITRESFTPVVLGPQHIIHCSVDGCRHVVTGKRQHEAWHALIDHCEYVHLREQDEPLEAA